MWQIYHGEIPEFLREFMDLDIMKRIENVGMNCGCEYTQFELFKYLKPYSRYDHSVGCALIIWHFTGDVKQSLSGLFHDISTPAFSHVIDFLHQDHLKQESTEEKTEEILASSAELKELLHRYHLSLDEIKDYHMYPIADNDTPNLSSDRLEYTLSNLYNYGFCTLDEIKEFYDNLVVGKNENGQIELCFQSPAIAEKFALCALKTAEIYVADADRLIMQILSDLIQYAVQRGVILEENLYEDEANVISRLLSDVETAQMWNQFVCLHEVKRAMKKPAKGIYRQVNAKKRWINPLVLDHGRIKEISKEFDEKSEAFLTQSFELFIGTDDEIINL